eukprot:TRINITY_DN106675_c0_g1_i1.p1 TRINITY_DN106675_c0_g1~~TRINITY_DN106675_c0_g1_i1.p1  ORF type:complete len:535 (-),score=49.61 TRINITY_DN106675_c0_g1_i1:59-1453(-)
MADPHVHHFGGSHVYMYSTHDQDLNVSNVSCCTGAWWIWQSEDLVTWEVVSQLAGFAWYPAEALHKNHLYWATDAAQRNGQFYWYVSIGGGSLAVVRGSSPSGPWEDVLGHLLFNASQGKSLNPPTDIRDPGTFRDDDGRYYIVFGACGGPDQPNDTCYYAAELHEDMVSYGQPKHLSVEGAMGPYGPGKADDKPFLHKHGETYYLSWGCFYATSSHVYGPYKYRGTFIDPALIEPAFRMNSTSDPWYTREDYADRHGSFLEWHGQWYFFMNDRSHSDALRYNQSGFNKRDTVAAYVHYFDNGTIAPLLVTAKGVGSHSFLDEPVLRAESYFSIAGAGRKAEDRSGGFKIAGLQSGSELVYTNVAGLSGGGRVLIMTTSNGGACSGEILVFTEAKGSRTLFARCDVPITGGWEKYQETYCTVSGLRSLDRIRQKLVLQFASECQGLTFAHLRSIASLAQSNIWQ